MEIPLIWFTVDLEGPVGQRSKDTKTLVCGCRGKGEWLKSIFTHKRYQSWPTPNGFWYWLVQYVLDQVPGYGKRAKLGTAGGKR